MVDYAHYSLTSGPQLKIFGQKKDCPRLDIQSMSFEYLRTSGDTFDKKSCRNPKVVFEGESMAPSYFEDKILEIKNGRWERTLKIENEAGDSLIFSEWFEKNYLIKK